MTTDPTNKIWLIEEQLTYAIAASVGDERVMQQAEALARWRYFSTVGVLPFWAYMLTIRLAA